MASRRSYRRPRKRGFWHEDDCLTEIQWASLAEYVASMDKDGILPENDLEAAIRIMGDDELKIELRLIGLGSKRINGRMIAEARNTRRYKNARGM